MSAASLVGVWAKLSRANGHRHAVEDLIERWREEKPYEFVHDQESQPGWTILTVRIRKYPPPEIGVIVGDYVHNVRSALDQLVWQLVIANGAAPGRHNQFPIAITEDNFIQNAVTGAPGRPGMLAGLSDSAVKFIERQQPYKRGLDAPSHPFAILQGLWNADKHQAIAQLVTAFTPTQENGGGSGVADAPSSPIEDGMELGRWITPPPNPPNPDGSVTGSIHSVGSTELRVLFGESQITLATLVSLREEAKRVVQHCAIFLP